MSTSSEPPSLSHLLSLPPSTRSDILQSALKSYPTLIPSTLHPLDESRYITIPNILKKQSHLTKTQLLQLLEWKLSHGKFRPTLHKLVDSNPSEVVEETTSRALSTFLKDQSKIKPALDILTELKGIGPATASLILSCADPEGTVFFGDEVAAWIFEDWSRKLKYNAKEYLELWERVREVKGELGLNATEVEKVGYVFGKRTAGGGGEGGKQGKAKRKVDDVEKKEESAQKPSQSRKKAKLEDISPPPPAGTRRSTRSTKKSND